MPPDISSLPTSDPIGLASSKIENSSNLDYQSPQSLISNSTEQNIPHVVPKKRMLPIDETSEVCKNNHDSEQSSLLVAVRVRPFSAKELKNLTPSELERYGYTLPSSDSDTETETDQTQKSEWGKGPIWKSIQVLDKHVLVFDPPDEDDSFVPNPVLNSAVKKSLSRANRIVRSNAAPIAASNQKHKDIRFVFDQIYGEDSSQEEVYQGTTKSLVSSVIDGYNSTVFAYGATGCGKTYTISGTSEDPGIIFLTMKELFDRIEQEKVTKEIEISLSYLEVYNETIRDIICPNENNPAGLFLREDAKNGVFVAGLSEHKPKEVQEVMDLVLKGNSNRTMCSTAANAASSRSHAVLQIHVKQKPKASGLKTDIISATLSIIDLAGSERATVTQNKGARMREGANINRSLLALANCINALCDSKKKRHIPYRDSKLTRLLKFSLGGNCRTVMITCISPASTYYEETLNTLKYASRAKNIKTTLNKNTVSSKVHVAQYTKKIQEQSLEIARLQKEILELRKRAPSSGYGQGRRAPIESKRDLSNGYSAQNPQDSRQAVMIEQSIQDIRNRMSQNISSASIAEYDYASASAINILFTQAQENLKVWRESFDLSGVEFNLLDRDNSIITNYKQKAEEILTSLAKQSRLAFRHADHAKNAIQTYNYSAQRSSSSARNIKFLSNEQKLRIDQDLKVLQLSSEKKGLQRNVELLHGLLEGFTKDFGHFFSLSGKCISGLKPSIDIVRSHIANRAEENSDEKNQIIQALECLDSIYTSAISGFSTATNRVEYVLNSVMTCGGPSKIDPLVLSNSDVNASPSTSKANSPNSELKTSPQSLSLNHTKHTTKSSSSSTLFNTGGSFSKAPTRKELLSVSTNNLRLARLASPRANKKKNSLEGPSLQSKPPTMPSTNSSTASNVKKKSPVIFRGVGKSNSDITYTSALRRVLPKRRVSNIALIEESEHKPSPKKRARSDSTSSNVHDRVHVAVSREDIKKVGFAVGRSARNKRLSIDVRSRPPVQPIGSRVSDPTKSSTLSNVSFGKLGNKSESFDFFGKNNNESLEKKMSDQNKVNSISSASHTVKLVSPNSMNLNLLNSTENVKHSPPVLDSLPKKSILKTSGSSTPKVDVSDASNIVRARRRVNPVQQLNGISSASLRPSLSNDIKKLIEESVDTEK
ncbi:hypothetical protein BB560_004780 [Smittium megazygosporum]|uniref:Kinesin-like protein KIN-8B n=1 Tax=Smittium megazygosporum TaxID=133381 RepID=A0A2T9Z8A4_9FUNG|nr:hypothetical protein BB560_004780 [Smittium megazygosporum]